ncbi:General transcription factor IIH subunit 4 [Ananas comosus]|uniref:RNA polymerase II transcription factor B subunit 2 n=1 Tax=Ananas comosus TaxID=4615 RepID=A0A199W379_ANACO|nr:General transcription factor IIH subunit 4 [Ananas comosus]
MFAMLFIDFPVTAKSMEEWVLADGLSKHKVAIDRLLQLRVIHEVARVYLVYFTNRKKETSYRMNPKFQKNLQQYLTHGGTLPREPMPPNVTVRLPTLEDLEVYAHQQWVLLATTYKLISSRKVDKLQLIHDESVPARPFEFKLMDTNAQLWYIIREYISTSEDRGVDPTDLISFLLELSFHTLGELLLVAVLCCANCKFFMFLAIITYNLNTLTDVQRNAIKDLADLGLVKLQQGRKESWFIPTKLATNLSVSLTDSSSRKEGFVVVETNFRMYAYSTSRLHSEILRLFSRIEYQLPNLIVGAITKESLYNAFENGITAEQIVSFLQQNAHPRVAEKIPTVPENVTDQIRLWETDRNRVEMIPSHLYEDFPSKDLFEACCDFAREYNCLLWEDSKKMRLIVRGEFHQQMRDFLRRPKQ